MELRKGLLLDSDIIIYVLRGKEPIVNFLESLRAQGYELAISAVTAYEVYVGMRSGEEEKIRAFLDSLVCLPVTREVAEKAAEYRRTFQQQGVTLQMPDLLIAATAFHYKLQLATYNRKDFPQQDISLWTDLPCLVD
ncbi:MAG: type II toxin-antitoxin system VapC family toxin [Armatimonadota bacterium]